MQQGVLRNLLPGSHEAYPVGKPASLQQAVP